MLHARAVMSNDSKLEPPVPALAATATGTEARGTDTAAQLQDEVGTNSQHEAQQTAIGFLPQLAIECGSAMRHHHDDGLVVADHHHDDTACEFHSSSQGDSEARRIIMTMQPPAAGETSLQPATVTERTLAISGKSRDDQPEALPAPVGHSGMARLECSIKPQADSDSKISRSDKIPNRTRCNKQIFAIVDHHRHHDNDQLDDNDAPPPAPASGQPEDDFMLPEDATGGPPAGRHKLEAASVKQTGSGGNQSPEAAVRVHQLEAHGAMSAAAGNAAVSAADMHLLKPKKPRRQLNRDYSQPGRYRGVRYRGDGRYSAELKVKDVRRWLGIYSSAEEAAHAFDRAAFEVRGKAAKLNFPELIVGAEVHRHGEDFLRMDDIPEEEDGRHTDDDVLYGSFYDAPDARQRGGPHWRRVSSSLPSWQAEGLRAMRKRRERRESVNNTGRWSELQYNECARSPGEPAAGGCPKCWESNPTASGAGALRQQSGCQWSVVQGSRHHAGERDGMEWEDVKEDVRGQGMGQHCGAYGCTCGMDYDQREIHLAADLHSPQQIMQRNNLPALQPQLELQLEAETNACVCGDSHTIAGCHTFTCASPPLLPPTSRCVHPHTHPLTARPLLRPDLNADPLDLLPPSLSLSASEAGSAVVRSLAGQPQRPQAAAAAAAAASQQAAAAASHQAAAAAAQQAAAATVTVRAQGMVELLQQQTAKSYQCGDARVLPVAGAGADAGAPGGMASNLGATLRQAPSAMLLDETAAGTGIASGTGGRGSSCGLLAATVDADADASGRTNHLHSGSSMAASDPRGSANDLPDSCAAKSR